MSMYNLIENSDNYFKTSGSLWHYYSDEPFLNANRAIDDFSADNNNSASCKFKTKIAGRTGNYNTKNVKIRVPLKYLSNFWRTFEMPLINCEINLILTWSNICFIKDNPIARQELTFKITDTKLFVPVVTLSAQDNVKLLEQLKSDFKRTINWNKYEPRVTVEQQNRCLDFLINPNFQDFKFSDFQGLFVLSFENNGGRTSYTKYYLPLVEIKNYNIVIDGRNFSGQPVKSNLITYDNIRKIATGQGDDYTTGCLLEYNYINNYYKMMAIDLSKQQVLDADPKAIQTINSTANLD